MSHRRCSLLILAAPTLLALAGTNDGSARAAEHRSADCFGAAPSVVITTDHIGSLPRDVTLGTLKRRCATTRWTTTNGDESLDTAIVLTRPGLRVIGTFATLMNDERDYRPLLIDSSAHVLVWKISGTAAVLPKGVPIDATWRDVARAYGPLRAFALNGVVYVTICTIPEIGILMDIPNLDAPINGVSPSTLDSVMATTRIRAVTLTGQKQPSREPAC